MATYKKTEDSYGTKYVVRWRDGRGQRQATFRRSDGGAAAAKQAYAAAIGEEAKRLTSAASLSAEDCTVAELYVSWREMTGPNKGWTEFTYETYDGLIDRHVPSAFLSRNVRTIRPRDVQEVVDSAGASVGRDRQRKLLSVLRRVLAHGVVSEYADTNPASSVSLASTAVVVKDQVRTADSSKVLPLRDALRIAAAHDLFYQPLAYTIVYTGRRISELAAVKVGDFDPEQGTLRISKTLTKGHTSSNGRPNTKTTKNGLTSLMYLPPDLVEILRAHCVDRDPSDWMFVNKKERGVRPNTFRRDHWWPAVDAAGLGDWDRRYTRPHGMRHTIATYLLSKNRSPVAITQQLGWKGTYTLHTVYSGYLVDSESQAIADTLQEAGESD